MQIKDKSVVSTIGAAGLWLCFTGPVFSLSAPVPTACDGANCVGSGVEKTSTTGDKPIVLSKFNKRKPSALRKSRSSATTSMKKSAGVRANKAAAEASETKASDKLPSWFANANAALPAAKSNRSADDQALNIAAADDDDIITMDGVQIASADQLNDMDRAVADIKVEVKSEDAIAVAVAPAPAAPQGRILRPDASGERHVVANSDSNPWSTTSLIGKIFIVFGALLTVASAVRMLIV